MISLRTLKFVVVMSPVSQSDGSVTERAKQEKDEDDEPEVEMVSVEGGTDHRRRCDRLDRHHPGESASEDSHANAEWDPKSMSPS